MADVPLRPVRLALVLLALACRGDAEPGVDLPPPFGFAAQAQQAFRLEAVDEIEVDGESVTVDRLADVSLSAEALAGGRAELTLMLVRFYMRVKDAPGGTSELAISDRGLISRAGDAPEQRLAPLERTPGGRSLDELLRGPIEGAVVSASGVVLGDPWHTLDPILTGVNVFDWVVLAFPVVEDGPDTWRARRRLPPLGQYRFGFSLPLQYEREPGVDGLTRIRASGTLKRSGVGVAEGLKGDIELEHAGEALVGPAGRVHSARIELQFRFEGTRGAQVTSRHRVEIRCTDCGEVVNPTAEESDTTSG